MLMKPRATLPEGPSRGPPRATASARQRKMIETGFADMKRNLGLTRLRLRGLTGANDEFLSAATVQAPRQGNSGHCRNRQLHQRRHDRRIRTSTARLRADILLYSQLLTKFG